MKTAGEIMDRDIPRLKAEDDARTAIDTLAKTDLGALPVVDDEDKVVVIVCDSELIISVVESDLNMPH
jgi:CBS-domain-containing membrane protein